MFRANRAILTTLMLFIAMTYSGCGTYVASIPPALLVHGKSVSVNGDFSDTIISVRCPAVIDAAVKPEVVSAAEALESLVWKSTGSHSASEIPDLMPVSSTYYAAELFVAISKEMPGATVILEPQFVTHRNSDRSSVVKIFNPDPTFDITTGDVVPKHLFGSTLPITLVVDVSDYSFAQGVFVDNMFSFYLRTAPILSPQTCGVLLAMKDQLAFHPTVAGGEGCSSSSVETSPLSVWYSGGVSPEAMPPPPGVVQALPVKQNAILLYPSIYESNSKNGPLGPSIPGYVTNGRPAKPEEVDQMTLHPDLVNFAGIVRTAPSAIRDAAKSERLLSPYIQTYDESLAKAVAGGGMLSATQQKNLDLIKKLLASELKVRSKRDGELARWILAGKFGASFREVQDKSYSNSKSQATAGLMQVASVGLTSAAALSVARSATGSSLGMLQQLTQVQTQLATMTSSLDKAGQDYYQRFVPSLEALEKATIEFGSEKITVNIADQAALRRSLKDLYARYKK